MSGFLMQKAGVKIPYTAWYRMEESSGSVLTDVSGNFDGTINSVSYSQTGQVDNCFYFNGTSNYCHGDLGTQGQTFPISYKFWINTDLSSTVFAISTGQASSWHQGIAVHLNTTGSILVNIGDGTGAGSTDRKSFQTTTGLITSNTWHQVIVMVESMTVLSCYVDGTSYSIPYLSGTATTMGWTGSDNYIMSRNGVTQLYSKGYLDELTSYLGVWTPTEIALMYARESSGNPMN